VPDLAKQVTHVITRRAQPITQISIDTKPAIYEIEIPDKRRLLAATPTPVEEKTIGTAVEALHAEERRMGRLFDASDMPLGIAGMTFAYAKDNQSPIYWSSHLKRGFDTEAWWISAFLLGSALAAYTVARVIAWIIDGFFGPAEPA
jgi:hypothetical protein